MIIKNIMEDIVLSVVKEVLRDEKYDMSFEDEQNVAAYILNRVSPKYVTSERGILHGKIEEKFMFQQKSDILFLVYEAIELLNQRRKGTYPKNSDAIEGRDVGYFHHMIGEVAEITTFSHISDMQISLLLNGEIAQMVDNTWSNPFTTNHGTNGYFHFWPKVDAKKHKVGDEVEFTIKFEHPKFKNKEVNVNLSVVKDFDIAHSKIIPISLFKVREGEDISFLYNEE